MISERWSNFDESQSTITCSDCAMIGALHLGVLGRIVEEAGLDHARDAEEDLGQIELRGSAGARLGPTTESSGPRTGPAEDVDRAAAPPEHRGGREVVGEDGDVPAGCAISSASASVEVPTSMPIDSRSPIIAAAARAIAALAVGVAPPPAGERRLVGVEDLAAPDRRPRRHGCARAGPCPRAPSRSRRIVISETREAVGDFRHRDEAVAVNEIEDAGMAGARGNASDLELGVHHQRRQSRFIVGSLHSIDNRSYSNIIAKSSVR